MKKQPHPPLAPHRRRSNLEETNDKIAGRPSMQYRFVRYADRCKRLGKEKLVTKILGEARGQAHAAFTRAAEAAMKLMMAGVLILIVTGCGLYALLTQSWSIFGWKMDWTSFIASMIGMLFCPAQILWDFFREDKSAPEVVTRSDRRKRKRRRESFLP